MMKRKLDRNRSRLNKANSSKEYSCIVHGDRDFWTDRISTRHYHFRCYRNWKYHRDHQWKPVDKTIDIPLD